MSALVAPDALESLLHACLDSQSLTGTSLFASEYLRKKVFSKYGDGNITADAENRALKKFLTHTAYVKDFKYGPRNLIDEQFLGNFEKRCWEFFQGIDPDDLSPLSLHQRGGVGPGASIAACGTDFLKKMYYGPVSATSLDVLHLYMRGCKTNPLCLNAAKKQLQDYGFVLAKRSRISFVEKNVDEARTIATEPSLNMYFQLGIASVINDRLLRVYGFSKSRTSDRNREMARVGSINGCYATIDLQSASDSVSVDLCKHVLPEYLWDLLSLFRCEESVLPSGDPISLPMVSTMGNGWTFTLMTALIYCALHAVCDTVGDSHLITQCSVFGDDIICPVSIYRQVVYILTLLGFIVNTGKSFSEGDFRESCGHDFLRGRFVRPVFIRRLDTTDSLYVAINRLAEWGSFHSIDLGHVLKYLIKHVPDYKVPVHYDYAKGVRVPSLLSTSYLTKWGSWRFKHLEPRPVSYAVTDEPNRKGSINSTVNPDACMVALIGGYLRNGRITERSERKVRWRQTTSLCPNWDTRDEAPCPGWDIDAERRWKMALFLAYN